MKVYTRGGDTGETSLFGGERVPKDAARVEAYGDVDELNSVLGIARAELSEPDLVEQLGLIQSSLFDLGAELATPDVEGRMRQGQTMPRVAAKDVEALESWIDEFDTELTPLAHFVLPGGTRVAGVLHLARTVCRRAERKVVALRAHEDVELVLVRYLNRLSDYLFTAARVANRRAGVEEPRWVGRER